MSDFQRLLALLGRDGSAVRVARGNESEFKHMLVPYDELPGHIAELSGHWNVWYEINPSAFNEPKGRSSSHHVTRLSALYADLDFKEKPAGMGDPSSALQVVADLSNALGTPPAAIVFSGHGIQPYWPIDDLLITDDNRNDVALFLSRWGLFVKEMAKANHGGADSVYDLARILRVPGPPNLKDPQHPAPTAIKFEEEWAPVDLEQVSDLLDQYGIHGEQHEVTGDVLSPSADWDWAEKSCHFTTMARHEIETSVPAGRHPWALKYAATLYGMVRGGCVTEPDFYELLAVFKARFEWLLENEGNKRPTGKYEFAQILKFGLSRAESWSTQKLAEELRQHTHDDELFDVISAPAVAFSAPPPEPPTATVSSIFTRQPIPAVASVPTQFSGVLALDVDFKSGQRMLGATFTDVGNAEHLALHLKGQFIHVPDVGWHRWDGSRYTVDSQGHVVEAAKDLFMQQLSTAPDEAHRKWAHSSLSAGKIDAALKLVRTVPFISVPSYQLDNSPYEMNTPGGIVNLRTGAIRPSNPFTDHHTKITGYTPERMPIPQFLHFLEWALGDQPRIEYMQRLFGAAAIGKLLYHIFPMLLGVGHNGKSALLGMILEAFGDYGVRMPAKFAILKRSDGHPTEIAQLQGVRIAVISEVPPKATFDEDLIKNLTGERALRARYMGKDFIDFPNQATFFLLANHLPTVAVGGNSWWNRARKIDFENVVLKRNENVNLIDEIMEAEGPGIMQWIVEGACQLLATGEQAPPKVTIATREYEIEEDVLARFFDEMIVDMEGVSISREHVYNQYRSWCVRQAATALNFIRFSREVVAMRPESNIGDKTEFVGLTMTSANITSDWGGQQW